MWRPQGSGMGFIIEYDHQHCICETQNNKTQVSCCLLPLGWGSRGTGFIMEYYLIVINPPTKKAKHGSDIT